MTDTAHPKPGDGSAKPQADHAELAKTLVQRIADLRAWLFLAALIIGFEIWARTSFGGTFILNPFNVQSIAIFAVAPLLLATGQTFVIISGGIDLSMGFIMGLAAVVAAHVINAASPVLGLPLGVLCGFLAGVLVATVPGAVNGSARLAAQGPALHRHARHVRRGARRRIPARRRHHRADPQLVLRGDRQRPRLRHSLYRAHHRHLHARDALPAEPDEVRPAQLRHRRQRPGRAPRRHRRALAPPAPLHPVGRLRRARRRALRRSVQRRRRPGRRAACCSTASRRW